MSVGEIAFLALVLGGCAAFAVVLFTVSGGFRGHRATTTGPHRYIAGGDARAGA